MSDGTGPNRFEQTVRSFQAAMAAEGIPAESIEHVVNRVLYGTPHPAPARPVTITISGYVGNPAALVTAIRAEVARGARTHRGGLASS